ncbi:MAG: Maf-like protein [Prevotella sp.]|nr:Maf-like protein [Prevotella sp.]
MGISQKYHLILSSNSPRRKQLLSGLGLCYEIRVIPDIDESYPSDLPVLEIAKFVSMKKADAYKSTMADDELIITADTIVVLDDKVLGKPHSLDGAKEMLSMLSGRTHHVVTGVCLTTKLKQKSFSVITDVTFKTLTQDEINYYVDHFKPLDKAGAYGIQEWIGYIGVTSIHGSYFNVMGFPVQRIYQELQSF